MSIDSDLAFVESVCGKCKHYEDEDDQVCLGCKKMDRAMRKLTHKELCLLGARWINQQIGVGFHGWNIIIEPGYRSEQPDVFAFCKYYSVVIECKASRSDFLADKRKPFRQNPYLGIGRMRYYLVNEGVATQNDMPDGWQLLIAYNKNTILFPDNFIYPYDPREGYAFDIRNATNEIELMHSWEYRKKHNCLPEIGTDNVAMIHPGYWTQEGWLEKNIQPN